MELIQYFPVKSSELNTQKSNRVYIDATYPYILCFVANKHGIM